jgi:hypothetical protein
MIQYFLHLLSVSILSFLVITRRQSFSFVLALGVPHTCVEAPGLCQQLVV